MPELQEKVQGVDQANERVLEILLKLHTVGCMSSLPQLLSQELSQASSKWQEVPLDDIEGWTVQTAESLKPVLQP